MPFPPMWRIRSSDHSVKTASCFISYCHVLWPSCSYVLRAHCQEGRTETRLVDVPNLWLKHQRESVPILVVAICLALLLNLASCSGGGMTLVALQPEENNTRAVPNL